MRVADLMETEVITTTPQATLKEVDELFTFNRISGAPVVDDGVLVGVISQSDVIRLLYDEQVATSDVSLYFMSPYPIPMPSVNVLAQQRAKIADHMINTTVREIMSVVPIVVGPDDHVRDAAQKMIDGKVHRLIVTNDHELAGVLSSLDLVGLVATDF